MVTTDEVGRDTPKRAALGLLLALAAVTVFVHALVGGRYGFHRDELATLDDARHVVEAQTPEALGPNL